MTLGKYLMVYCKSGSKLPHSKFFLSVLASLVLLTACASDNKPGQDATKLTEFKQTAKFKVRWRKDIGIPDNNVLWPAVTPDGVFVANARGRLSQIDRITGNRIWQVDTGFNISAGAGAGGGLVLVGGMKGDVAAYEENGKLRWRTKVSSEVLSAPQIADGIVVVRTGDSRITGLDASDGKRLWLYERATPALIVRSQAEVAIKRSMVFAGFAGGRMVAIGLGNGTVIWEAVVSQPRGNTELERISDITSVPVLDNDQVCAIAFQGQLACFGLEKGNLLWSREHSSDKGMALLDNNLYVTDDKGAVLALDKASGSSVWKNDQLARRHTSTPYALGNYLLVGDYEGYLHALNRSDGSLVARLKTDGSDIMATPVEMDGGILLQTSDGHLYSIALH